MKIPTCAVASLLTVLLALAPAARPAEGKVKFELFAMSKCPFNAQLQVTLVPVLKALGKSVEFTLDFIGNDQDGNLTSLHGDSEVQGDKVQICAAKHAPAAYLDLLACMSADVRAIPDNWAQCATAAKLPEAKIRSCAEGDEGQALLRASFARSAKREARYSPNFFIDGKPYAGGRSEKALSRALCAAFGKGAPKYCASLPAPVKVQVLLLSDSRCKECQTDTWKERIGTLVPGSEIRILDWGTPEGRKLYGELHLTVLPVYLFDRRIRESDDFERLQRFLRPAGDYLVLELGVKFDPTKEICDNGIDDNGNGLVDCQDPDCTFFLGCRPEATGKLEVFIMSQCPFAVKGLDAMKEVLSAFGDKIQFEVHFIAEEREGEFSSLHGPAEVAEDLRELCAMKYYPKGRKFMDYILCRDLDIRSEDWKACASESTGIDPEKIEHCSTGEEGQQLLRQDIRIAQGLQIAASPTWIVNNRKTFNGIDSRTIRDNFCRHNEKLPGCGLKVEADPKGAPAECNP